MFETSTSIIKHLTKYGCVRREELVDKAEEDEYETQCNNPWKSRHRAYSSTNVLACAPVQKHSEASEPTQLPKAACPHIPLLPPRWINPAGRQQIASAKEIIKVPRKEDLFSSCVSSGETMAR